MIALEQTMYLGPATVLKASPGRVKLELPDEHAWAIQALAFPYEPAVGDVVLTVGKSGVWYVIGVLKGSGTTKLLVPGNLVMCAPPGRISLESAEGIDIRAPEIRLTSSSLEVIATSVMERFAHATRWVKDTFQLRVGRLRTRVETTYDLRANRIRESADDDVKIDGQQIDLG